MKTEAMTEWLGKLLEQYEGRHIKPILTARIVPETRHHPIAPPRPEYTLRRLEPYLEPVSTAQIVRETRRHPIASPRPGSYFSYSVETCGLLIRADNDLADIPLRRSYGESMDDRMDIVERLTNAAASFAGGIDGTIERRDFHEALRSAGFDFWGGVRKYLSTYTRSNSHLVR